MALTFIKTTCAAMCAALALACTAAGATAPAPARSDLLAARDAVTKGHWKDLRALAPRFAGTALEAYPDFWLLDGDIERADPGQVQAFLERYPGGALAESLRRDWLKVLGAQGAWDLFRPQYALLVSGDTELACYAWQERLARGDDTALGEAHRLFVAGRDAPQACDPVFARLAPAGLLSEDEIWSRLRRRLAAGDVREAKRVDALLPAARAIRGHALDRAAAHPRRYLDHERAKRLSRARRELAAFAVARLARDDPDAAAERLERLAPRLGTDAGYAWSQLAFEAALNHHPRALEWYARAGAVALGDSQTAWKARAALRAGDWRQVRAAIDALPRAEAREPRWRYWAARALRELGRSREADAMLRSIAAPDNFYGLLAAGELGIEVAPDWKAVTPTQAEIASVAALAGIQRALALYGADLPADGLREWLWAIRGLDDRHLLAAAELARRSDIPDRAINTAERTLQLHDYSRRFPLPHRQALAAAAREWDLDEAMLYGLIRQESRFMTEVRSPMGAVGLMQIMPRTARWIARQIPVRPFRTAMLERPDVNLTMGSYYYHRVLTALGNPILATAAYNAGPARARRWRDDKALEGAIYAETIPFTETREYVKKVFTNAWFYRQRLGGEAASLQQLLGDVPGRDADSPMAANIP